jgi:hypothetical protein
MKNKNTYKNQLASYKNQLASLADNHSKKSLWMPMFQLSRLLCQGNAYVLSASCTAIIFWRHDSKHNDIHHNDIHHNDIHHNDIHHNDIHHNDIHHNYTQHNAEYCYAKCQLC